MVTRSCSRYGDAQLRRALRREAARKAACPHEKSLRRVDEVRYVNEVDVQSFFRSCRLVIAIDELRWLLRRVAVPRRDHAGCRPCD